MNMFEHLWLIFLIVMAIPLVYYRMRFKKAVYQTDSWKVVFKLSTLTELKAFFGNTYPDNEDYLKSRNIYRSYTALFVVFITFFIFINIHKTMHKIEKGSNVPGFTLPDQNGDLFDINTVLGKKNLVIYFYPKDDTPGCTKEACYFRDQFDVFKEEDAIIIGISGQSVESHKAFATKYKLNYTLLSDEGNEIRKLFGVPTNFLGFIPGRVTYVVNKKGKVVYTFNSQSQATKHVDEALRILKLLK
jgi:peroxiredoxin Q/BCP